MFFLTPSCPTVQRFDKSLCKSTVQRPEERVRVGPTHYASSLLPSTRYSCRSIIHSKVLINGQNRQTRASAQNS